MVRRPAAHWRPITDAVIDHLSQMGDLIVDPVAVGLLVKKTTTFVELRPVRADLRLSMIHHRTIDHARIQRRVALSGDRVAHFVDLGDAADVDEQIRQWLAESYLDAPD